MSLCECECEEHTTALLEELQTLREENKSIQKTLVQIRLIVEDLTTKKKQEIIRQRERTW